MRKSRTSKKSNTPKTRHGGKTSRDSSRSSRMKKIRDMQPPREMSSGSETSSLDPHAKIEVESPNEPAPEEQRMDSGDLQAVSDVEDSSLESTAELIDEGQDLQAETVEAMEDSAENDGKRRKVRDLPGTKVPAFKDRNRL
jgi:hypothetical protein